jgi:hypothetical protein
MTLPQNRRAVGELVRLASWSTWAAMDDERRIDTT